MKKTTTYLALVAFLLIFASNLWSQNINPVHVVVTSPSGAIDWTIDGIQANAWDGDLNFAGSISGQLVTMRDDTPDDSVAIYCCVDAIINPETIDGNIALISRGDCEFSDKAWHAEKNGAIASIVGNRAPIGTMVGTHTDGLVWMAAGAQADSVNTPSIFIAWEDHIVLRRMIEDEGLTVNVSIEAAYIYDVAAAYSYRTPQEQIVTLDNISMDVLNRDTVDLYDVTFTAEITDPDGMTTTLTETVDSLAAATSFVDLSGEYLITFTEGYTPSAVGEYTVNFSAATQGGGHALDASTATTDFWITDDHTFANNNGEIVFEEGLALYPETYISPAVALRYDIGSIFRTGENEAMASFASFGLYNPGVVPEGAEFAIRVYNADADGDGVVDTAFDPADALGSVTYEMTGNEVSNQPITVEFDNPVSLHASGMYLLMFEIDGLSADVQSSPSFTATGGPATPGSSTVFRFGEEYEVDGWEYWNDDTPGFPHAGRRPISSMHLEGFISGIQDVLDASKISLGPVPASSFLTLNLELENVSKEVRVGILDFNGRIVMSQEFENIQQLEHQFDVHDFAPGTYFLSVLTEEGYRAKKFQVLR